MKPLGSALAHPLSDPALLGSFGHASLALPATMLLVLLGDGAEGHSRTCFGSVDWGGPNSTLLMHATAMHAFASGSCPFRQNKLCDCIDFFIQISVIDIFFSYTFDGSLELKLRGISNV